MRAKATQAMALTMMTSAISSATSATAAARIAHTPAGTARARAPATRRRRGRPPRGGRERAGRLGPLGHHAAAARRLPAAVAATGASSVVVWTPLVAAAAARRGAARRSGPASTPARAAGCGPSRARARARGRSARTCGGAAGRPRRLALGGRGARGELLAQPGGLRPLGGERLSASSRTALSSVRSVSVSSASAAIAFCASSRAEAIFSRISVVLGALLGQPLLGGVALGGEPLVGLGRPAARCSSRRARGRAGARARPRAARARLAASCCSRSSRARRQPLGRPRSASSPRPAVGAGPRAGRRACRARTAARPAARGPRRARPGRPPAGVAARPPRRRGAQLGDLGAQLGDLGAQGLGRRRPPCAARRRGAGSSTRGCGRSPARRTPDVGRAVRPRERRAPLAPPVAGRWPPGVRGQAPAAAVGLDVSAGRASRRPVDALPAADDLEPVVGGPLEALELERQPRRASAISLRPLRRLADGRRASAALSVVSGRWSTAATRWRSRAPRSATENDTRPMLSTAPTSITSAAANASHAPVSQVRRRAAGRRAEQLGDHEQHAPPTAAGSQRRRGRTARARAARRRTPARAAPSAASSTSASSKAPQAVASPYQSRNRLTSSTRRRGPRSDGPISNRRHSPTGNQAGQREQPRPSDDVSYSREYTDRISSSHADHPAFH